jgi:predicted RND superfamily exporter protein
MRADRRLFFWNLLLALGLGALAWPFARQAQVDSSADAILATDTRNRETYEKIGSLLPDTTFAVVAARHPALFSNAGAALVAELSESLAALPDAMEVKSLTHSARPVRKGFGLDFRIFMPLRATEREWAAIREFCTRFVMSRNILVSADGEYALFLVMVNRHLETEDDKRAFRDQLAAAVAPFRARTTDLRLLSFPLIELETREHLTADLGRYGWALAAAVPVILFATLRSVWLLLTLLLNVGLGLLGLTLLIALNGEAVNLYLGILYPLTAGVQLTFLVHVLTATQDAQREGRPGADAVAQAVRETLRPAGTAALTTLAGLGSLGVCDIPVVRAFGAVGAQAVALVFLLAYAGPAAILTFSRRRPSAPAPGLRPRPAGGGLRGELAAIWGEPTGPSAPAPPRPADTAYAGFAAALARRAPWILLAALALSLAFLPGWPRLRTDIRAIEFLHPDSGSRQTIELLDRRLGGINIFQLEVDTGRPGGIQDLATLAYLEKIRNYGRTLPGVSDAYAYSQVFTVLQQVWSGRTDGRDELPSPALMMVLRPLLAGQEMMFKDAFVGPREQSCLLILRTPDLPAREYLALLEDFLTYAEQHKPAGFSLTPAQGLHTILEQDRRIVRSQVESVAAGAALVFLVLALLWRAPVPAALVLLINAPALVVLAGCMGYFGLPLNSVTVMIDAVVLGITTDEGIHFISYYRTRRAAGDAVEEALRATLAHKLRPMLCTTALLGCGLGLFLLSSFPPVADFGLLSLVALGLCVLSAATVLPALLFWRERRAARSS